MGAKLVSRLLTGRMEPNENGDMLEDNDNIVEAYAYQDAGSDPFREQGDITEGRGFSERIFLNLASNLGSYILLGVVLLVTTIPLFGVAPTRVTESDSRRH